MPGGRAIITASAAPVKMKDVSQQPVPTPERPSRYDRSFGGLMGAMLVTVLFVVAYVGFRALIRDQPEIVPEVDYVSEVQELERVEVTVVHPCRLPEGWRASSTSFTRGTPPAWGLGLVTDDGEFVGLRQEQADVEDLLASFVDESPTQGEDAAPANHLGVTSWATWSDGGGDHAFSTTLPSPLTGQTLLVYGSASVAQQEQLIDLLTTARVGDASAPC